MILGSLMPKAQENTTTDLIYKAIGWLTISLLLLLLLAFIVGGPFRPILKYVGLEIHGFGGVFINCDDPRNMNADFCRPNPDRIKDREEKSDKRMTEPGGLPFTLHN